MTIAHRNERARSIADVGAGVILATIEIASPPERVWTALTTAEVARWRGSPDTYKTTAWTADLRVGGEWRADGEGEKGPFHIGGEILAIDAPRTIVQTWKQSWQPGASTTVTYLLEPIDGGTRVTVRHEGFGNEADACRDHAEGWTRVLGWLAGFTAPAPAPVRHYLLRLVPPRPTFAQDMTADEAATMKRHAAYWMGHLAKGTVIAFGPVADPSGAWGLGLVAAKDDAEVSALEANDPAITFGMGLRYERLPMPVIRH